MTAITHIITGLNVGGAERALYTLLTHGLEGPFRNRVISLMGPGHYGALLKEAGISVSCLNMQPAKPTLSAVLKLSEAVKAAPADILQGWMLHGNLAATLASRFINRRAALAWNQRLSMETLSERSRFNRGLIRLEARFSEIPQAIIYNSSRSRRQFADLGYKDQRALHIPNGFNTNIWSPNESIRQRVRQTLALSETTRVIGYVGRGHSQKDIPNLLCAFEKVVERHPDAVLIAVGRDLDNYVSTSDRVRFLGQRTDIPDLMRAFDVLCLSSRAEGFPNVVGEAMASGVPCVTTDVGDARDIVGDTGWVAPPRNSERLATCLDQALSCAFKDLVDRGNQARDRIALNFSIASVVERYTSLYRSMIRESI